MNSAVTPALVRDFERDGYLILHRPVFSPEKFERVRAYCAEKFAEAASSGGAPAIIDCPHWRDPRMFEWIFADEMLDVVQPIVGPDIAVFACHLLQKPAAVGKRVPWHEDSAYWKGVLDPMAVTSVTLALEPCTPANGCLRVIPGTHRHGYSDYAPVSRPEEQVFNIEIKKEQVDESKAVDIALAPNEASLHDGRIIHGSNPNLGQQRRAVLTVRYFPASAKFLPEKHEFFKRGFHIYLARGRNVAGNRYSEPGKNYDKNDKISTA